MNLPYTEGSVFLVPLRGGCYARGVVARAAPKGGVLYGYFFGPPLRSCDAVPVDDLGATTAVLKLRFGDLGLMNSEWLVRGTIPSWDRTQWPMSDFVRRNPLTQKAVLVRYSDDNPNKITAERPCDATLDLPTDSLSGYRAVEIKLSKIFHLTNK
jgi:hypothetical protein